MNRAEQTQALICTHNLPKGEIERLGEGAFGEVFLVRANPLYVVKWQKKHGMAADEAAFLNEMRKLSVVPVPQVLGVFPHQDEGEDAMLLSFLPGVPLFCARLTRAAKMRFRVEFSKAVEAFLAPPEGFGYVGGKVYSSWEEFYRKKAETLLQKARLHAQAAKLSAKTLLVMERTMQLFQQIFGGKSVRRAFVHGDLNPQNIMVLKSGAISGFFDPIGSFYGDSEYELFQFDLNGGKQLGLCKAYQKRVTLSKDYVLKRNVYRLFAEVGYYYDAGILEGKEIKKFASELNRSLNKLHL